MTPEQIQLLNDVNNKLNLFLEVYYKTNFPDKTIFNKEVVINGKFTTKSGEKMGLFGSTPVVQPAAIAAPSGGATIDTQCRSTLSTLLTELSTLGIIG